MLRWEDAADKESKWKSFVTDKIWAGERKDSEKHDGPWVVRSQNSYLRLAPYSPEPRIEKAITELRIYTTAPGKMPELHSRFADHTIGFFAKHNIDVVGFWNYDVGNNSQLIYMLEYSDLGEREQKWDGFQEDPDWISTRAFTERNGPIVTRVENSILRPPRFLLGQ